MKEPCASCSRRLEDFRGCRCQALALTGDARATDQVCHLSPYHDLVADLAEQRDEAPYIYDVSALTAPQRLKSRRWADRTNCAGHDAKKLKQSRPIRRCGSLTCWPASAKQDQPMAQVVVFTMKDSGEQYPVASVGY